MQNKIIRFCYYKVIDQQADGAWEQLLWQSTYNEYLLQAQFYDREKTYDTFSELLFRIPDAEKLHFKVSAAAVGYLRRLNHLIPDIITNSGKQFLRFEQFEFVILESSISDQTIHSVALRFYSDPVKMHAVIGDYFLLSTADHQMTADGTLTEMIRLQDNLSIYSIKDDSGQNTPR